MVKIEVFFPLFDGSTEWDWFDPNVFFVNCSGEEFINHLLEKGAVETESGWLIQGGEESSPQLVTVFSLKMSEKEKVLSNIFD